jgi:hypothetical protein
MSYSMVLNELSTNYSWSLLDYAHLVNRTRIIIPQYSLETTAEKKATVTKSQHELMEPDYILSQLHFLLGFVLEG